MKTYLIIVNSRESSFVVFAYVQFFMSVSLTMHCVVAALKTASYSRSKVLLALCHRQAGIKGLIISVQIICCSMMKLLGRRVGYALLSLQQAGTRLHGAE